MVSNTFFAAGENLDKEESRAGLAGSVSGPGPGTRGGRGGGGQ